MQTITLNLGRANPKQAAFYAAEARFVAYGGARGGGKSHAVRVQAIRGALMHPGIRILIVRRTYPELETSLIEPMLPMLPREICSYNGTARRVDFINGSRIRFGHLSGPAGEGEYQGQEYDWIFLDEATAFTEREFRLLGACLRGVTPIPRRFYITCNPGGVGHEWVKRLFVDRDYLPGENGADYQFIPATVDDNFALKQAAPEYISMLDALPEDLRRAHRYGDWEALSGRAFPEFRADRHVTEPVSPPAGAQLWRAVDYGLDCFACLWIALSPGGEATVYRELWEKDLVASAAARAMLAAEGEGEKICGTIAPADLKSRQKDSGRSVSGIFAECGAPFLFAPAGRVRGWMMVHELLRGGRLRITKNCTQLIRSLSLLMSDPTRPGDCLTQPHEITHAADALRYFAVFRAPEGEDVSTEFDSFRHEGDGRGLLYYGM